MNWSDGIERPESYREPDEHRFVVDIFGRRLDSEWQKLKRENLELRAQLAKQNKTKAAGAK